MVTCLRCGAANMPRDTTCYRCGAPLRPSAAEDVPEGSDGLRLPDWLNQPLPGVSIDQPIVPILPEADSEQPRAQFSSPPTSDLAAGMPDWLAAGPPIVPHPDPAAPPSELFDPTTFISEDDLPEWLRQLGAATSRPIGPDHPPQPLATDESGHRSPSLPPPVEIAQHPPAATDMTVERAAGATSTADVSAPARRSGRIGYVVAAIAVVLLVLTLLLLVR